MKPIIAASTVALALIVGITIASVGNELMSSQQPAERPNWNLVSPFDAARLNNGIAVDAPDDWRWVRDGITLDSFLAVAGRPEANKASGSGPHSLREVAYGTDIDGTRHVFLFDQQGFLRFFNWYVGLQDAPDVPAPAPRIRDNLRIRYPRIVPMAWSGDATHGYEVVVEIEYPDGWAQAARYYTKQTGAVHQHTGANKGRWKVRALTKSGGGQWSEYVTFTCTG